VSQSAQSRDPEAHANTSIRIATFDQYRSLLFSIAYRMLGSVADAEDILQDTFIRWQQSAGGDIRSPRRSSSRSSVACASIISNLPVLDARSTSENGCRNRS
jgi:hypothetical protein